MLWAKFDRAIEDLAASVPMVGGMRVVIDAAVNALKNGQRFYLPESQHVLGERRFDDGVKGLLRLPYEVTCLLSETFLDAGESGRVDTWFIAIAFDKESTLNQSFGLIPTGKTSECGFGVISIVFLPERRLWCVTPAIARVSWREHEDGIDIQATTPPEVVDVGWESEMLPEINGLTNLCVMLGLANVASELRSPPVKVNKKRVAAGRVPLYSYHVLVVDGDRWESSSGGCGSGREVRSHLRRGHIRRLSEERLVWVRAAYVHGKRDGFVDKDYAVEARAG